MKCVWCGKRRRLSEWEQRTTDGEYRRLCNKCADRWLNNPLHTAIVSIRRTETPAPADNNSPEVGT